MNVPIPKSLIENDMPALLLFLDKACKDNRPTLDKALDVLDNNQKHYSNIYQEKYAWAAHLSEAMEFDRPDGAKMYGHMLACKFGPWGTNPLDMNLWVGHCYILAVDRVTGQALDFVNVDLNNTFN